MDDSDTSFIPHGGAWKRPVLLSDSESDTDTTESAETSLGDQDDSLFVVNSVASSSPVSTVKAPTKKRGNVARKIIESDSDEPSDDDDLLQPSALTPQKLSPKLNYSPPPEATTTTSTTTTDSPDSLSDLLGSLTIQPSPDPNWVAQSSGPHPYYSLSSSPTTSPFIPPPLFSSLYPHQRTGVQWIHDVHHHECPDGRADGWPGGILGDDMGLGKVRAMRLVKQYLEKQHV